MAHHSSRMPKLRSGARIQTDGTFPKTPILELDDESQSDEEINLRPVLPKFESSEETSQVNADEIDMDFDKSFNKDVNRRPKHFGRFKHVPNFSSMLSSNNEDSSDDVETDDENDEEQLTERGHRGSTADRANLKAGTTRNYIVHEESPVSLSNQTNTDNRTDLDHTETGTNGLKPLHYKSNRSQSSTDAFQNGYEMDRNTSSESIAFKNMLKQDALQYENGGLLSKLHLPSLNFMPSLSDVLHNNHHPNVKGQEHDSVGTIRRGNQNDIELGIMNKSEDSFNFSDAPIPNSNNYDYIQSQADNGYHDAGGRDPKYKMGITTSLMKLWGEMNKEKISKTLKSSQDDEPVISELKKDQSTFLDNLEVINNRKKLMKEVERTKNNDRHHRMASRTSRELKSVSSRSKSRSRSRLRAASPYSLKNSTLQLVTSLNSSHRLPDSEAALETPLAADSVPTLPSFNMPRSPPVDASKGFKRPRSKSNMARITVHISDVLTRQKFLLMLCKAFMLFGAPNHRLEEYMTLTAKVLELEASFLYFPGIMLASFGDPVMRTSDMKLIRVGQGLNLAKLDESHEIYDLVVHDRLGVEEACGRLEELFSKKPQFNTLMMIIFYGINSAFIIIWFGGSWADMGPSAVMGILVGFLQLVVAPRNTMYSSVFEVGSCIIVSFLGRALGSINMPNGSELFCFPAVVLSGLSMILPGYIILSGALEIQARSIVSGTVRMFYAIIYSLFMGFGMTLGSGIYGWLDHNASTTASCKGNIPSIMNLLFIPMFAITMALACQASFKQTPVMVIIACAGYTVDYFSAIHLPLTQFNAAMGAFTIGVLSNVYSKFCKQYDPIKKITYCETAFTSMLVGIFCLVPGGVAGRNVLAASIGQLSSTDTTSNQDLVSASTLTFGITMIEVAIGITVGLFLAALVVYPFGKKRTGLFSL